MHPYRSAKALHPRGGFTFVEVIVVAAIILLLVGFFSLRLLDRIDDAKLDRDVNQFVTTLRGAVQEAILRKENLAVVIEVHDGYYTVYQETEPGKYDEEVEPLFTTEQLRLCWIDDMQFDDGEHQYSGKITFWATPQGWSGSVLFNLLDDEDRERFVRIDRYTTRVLMDEQPLELLEAKSTITM
jgi:prepilin-type N-terminal cleavage/methylation domain-containing protein